MTDALAADDLPVAYLDKFREYGIEYQDGGSARQLIAYCPWCGARLPASLRDAWFDRLDLLGLEPDDPRIPAEMRTDRWWRDAGL